MRPTPRCRRSARTSTSAPSSAPSSPNATSARPKSARCARSARRAQWTPTLWLRARRSRWCPARATRAAKSARRKRRACSPRSTTRTRSSSHVGLARSFARAWAPLSTRRRRTPGSRLSGPSPPRPTQTTTTTTSACRRRRRRRRRSTTVKTMIATPGRSTLRSAHSWSRRLRAAKCSMPSATTAGSTTTRMRCRTGGWRTSSVTTGRSCRSPRRWWRRSRSASRT
mmetsp:Transcript_21364/g.60898  ORF Transcript_21364/g.60898 Transcript_21364/m.60898 type:complete len:226 (-) Transcript_21364:95-772(-)